MLANLIALISPHIYWPPSFYFSLVGQELLLATLKWKFERGVGEHSYHSCGKVQKDKKGVGQHSFAKMMEFMLVPFILFLFVWLRSLLGNLGWKF